MEEKRSFVVERGVRLDERRWVPKDVASAKAFVFLAHGYGHHIDAYAERVGAEELARKGLAVFGVSHHSHGHSEGLRTLVHDYNHLVDDYVEYVRSVHDEFKEQGVTKPCFIIGQSMGGAISILAAAPTSPIRNIVSGVVLLAPMCKIADEMMLPQWVINTMYWTAYLLPWAPLTPVKPTEDLCFKDPAALERSKTDPLGYHGRPRLMTGYQMLQMITAVQEMIPTFDAPFLVLHGGADKVTSPRASQELHEKAASSDKKIVMFEDMWHAMLSEPDPNPQLVKDTFVQWMLERS